MPCRVVRRLGLSETNRQPTGTISLERRGRASTARGRKGRHRPAFSRNRKRSRQRTEPAANDMSSQDASRQEKLATRMSREAQQRRNQGCAASSFRSPNGSSPLDQATGNAFFVSFSPTTEVSQGLARIPAFANPPCRRVQMTDGQAVDGTSILREDRLPRADRMPGAHQRMRRSLAATARNPCPGGQNERE